MFWEGFIKQASRLGVKGVYPVSAAGKMVGNKPKTLVTTAGAQKKIPLPTALPSSAEHISQPKLPDSASIK